MLPHSPWRFLPSGQEFPALRTSDGELDGVWADDPWLVTQAYQRHLLQVGYTDRVLGRLLRALIRMGVYDDSLVVVTADHGASFAPGRQRREVTSATIADIARVPMFVKYPHQRGSAVDPRPARTVDILPTIADVLEIRLPWAVDGTSLLRRTGRRTDVVVRGDEVSVRVSLAEVERRLGDSIRSKTEVFGHGGTSIFRIGVHRRLLGTKVLQTHVTDRVRVELEDEGAYADVDTEFVFSPALISGFVERGALDKRVELAVAVNGRVRALTRCFSAGGRERFRALVPPSSFRPGFNRIEVFMIDSEGGTSRLVRIGSNVPGGGHAAG
jgi:hypothetical protein